MNKVTLFRGLLILIYTSHLYAQKNVFPERFDNNKNSKFTSYQSNQLNDVYMKSRGDLTFQNDIHMFDLESSTTIGNSQIQSKEGCSISVYDKTKSYKNGDKVKFDNKIWVYQTDCSKDTEAPTAPSNLQVSDITKTSLKLIWGKSSDNMGVVGYDIYQFEVKIGSVSPGTATTFTATGLTENTSYTFKVRAKDAAGNISSWSNVLKVKTSGEAINTTDCSKIQVYESGRSYSDGDRVVFKARVYKLVNRGWVYQFDCTTEAEGNSNDTEAPTAPSNLQVSDITKTSLKLIWGKSSDNTGVVGYDIYQFEVKIGSVSPGTATTFTATGLTENTSYTFKVRAKDAAGNISSWSNVLKVKTSGEAINTTDCSKIQVYESGRSYSDGDRVVFKARVYKLVNRGWVYQFDCTTEAEGNSNDTEAPTAPSNLQVSDITKTSLKLIWGKSSDNTGVVGYDIYQFEVKIGSVSPWTATTFTATGLTENTSYTFKVRAKDAAGNISSWSNVLKVKTSGEAINTTDCSKIQVYESGRSYSDGDRVVFKARVYKLVNRGWVYQFDCTTEAEGNSNDTEAPTAPTNLKGSDVTQSSVKLTWSASTDNKGVLGYHIFIGNRYIGKVSSGSTSYTATRLSSNTRYSFVVRAKDVSGNFSKFSNRVFVTTQAQGGISTHDTEVPTAPTNLKGSDVTQSSVKLTWSASTDNKGVLGYHIFIGNRYIGKVSSGSTSYTATRLSSNTRYSFVVRAKDVSGNFSKFSNRIFVTTQAQGGTSTTHDTEVPTAPTNLRASNITQSSVKLTWSASTDNKGVLGYHIFIGNRYIGKVSSGSTSYTATRLSSNTRYSFVVRAKDVSGNFSKFSNRVFVTTQAQGGTSTTHDTEVPTAPTNLRASNITRTTVRLLWNPSYDNKGVMGYHIYSRGTLIGKVTSGSITYFDVKGLQSNSWYKFVVYAIDFSRNFSKASNIINIRTASGWGRHNTKSNADVKIYPNPIEQSFSLNLKKDVNGIPYTIFDSSGKILKRGVYQSSVDIQDLNLISGTTYHIKFYLGKEVINKKFVKK